MKTRVLLSSIFFIADSVLIMIKLVPWWSTNARIFRIPPLLQCPRSMKCNFSSYLLRLLEGRT
ncbi:hypothetical protein NC653_002556 [Populus alba x Populus x berolinensis]|uniref:Uncharacterized protein n=1 Tax=Populus alba x Populus x berolinensis TaxID=444605 RepID=A0AAD6RP55_9ROSI|nr:hypothetical protein NC653_002556 [Populus alba x Populus x berolinensis]